MRLSDGRSWADRDAVLLGAIADDFTGATDLCSMLVRNGMRTVQLIGVPEPGLDLPEADAVVVALKSRTAPVAEAVAQSLAAQSWLQAQGARQYLFKYCSTFDSTDAGNIGPVADALLDARGQRTSPSSARPSPRPAARSSRVICSSATCCSPIPTCGTTR